MIVTRYLPQIDIGTKSYYSACNIDTLETKLKVIDHSSSIFAELKDIGVFRVKRLKNQFEPAY